MVRLLTAEDDPSVIAAPIARAFYDYVIPRRGFAASPGRYEDWVDRMMRESITRRRMSSIPVLVAEVEERPVGVAVLNFDHLEQPPESVALFETFVEESGPECRAFFDAFFAVVDAFPFPTPNLYVSMLGVDPAFQRRGIGRALLEAAHEIAQETPGCQGLCLDTESAANVALYESCGFRVVGSGSFDDIDVWGLHRPVG